MRLIGTMDELAAYLSAFQRERGTHIKCELTPALSARVNDAALVEILVMELPMAQGIQHRIVRSRGRGAVLTAKVRYREGVRMIDRFHGGIVLLSEEESSALEEAKYIASEAITLADQEARFRHVYDWVCRNIRYVHTAPGQKAYEQLVGAAGVLKGRQANCQGFADVLYLLCGLCGIECEYRCGLGEKRLHVWNAVCLAGEWRDVDVSKGARNLSD